MAKNTCTPRYGDRRVFRCVSQKKIGIAVACPLSCISISRWPISTTEITRTPCSSCTCHRGKIENDTIQHIVIRGCLYNGVYVSHVAKHRLVYSQQSISQPRVSVYARNASKATELRERKREKRRGGGPTWIFPYRWCPAGRGQRLGMNEETVYTVIIIDSGKSMPATLLSSVSWGTMVSLLSRKRTFREVRAILRSYSLMPISTNVDRF